MSSDLVRYDIGFYIGPCSEDDAFALVDRIMELPEFRNVGGGGISAGRVRDDDPLFVNLESGGAK